MFRTEEEAIKYLRTPVAIRERCTALFQLIEAGKSDHFRLHIGQLSNLVVRVKDEIKLNYPDFNVPYHSRWRHFSAGNIDREAVLDRQLASVSAREKAKAKIELAIVSVLLDAGAGENWSYKESDSGLIFVRSEGLAVASFHAFQSGIFGGSTALARGEELSSFNPKKIERAFAVTEKNPLLGVEGRAQLMRSLGAVVLTSPDFFGSGNARLGNILDILCPEATSRIAAPDILKIVLEVFAPIWPGRVALGGQNLGDVWIHSQVKTNDATSGMIPFHKLSQWLTYSLLEPIAELGVEIEGVDELTGLAEYRNGGLFVDGGVLELVHSDAGNRPELPSSEMVVEWRAATVHLLDLLAGKLREELGMSAGELPLAKVLQGGTWSVGRKLAFERRPNGAPPISIVSDGTVF